MDFLTADFMLQNKTGRRLYHEVAEQLPIIDYHCHLNPAEIAGDKRFASITEVWLGGDHYKWRLERLAGVDEALITGNAPDLDKFVAYASALETAVGNPLYHWSHLEMQRYFNIHDHLTVKNAPALFEQMNRVVASPSFSARRLIEQSNVRVICTTDDPADDLAYHSALAADPVKNCRVLPTFRPDKAVLIDRPEFPAYMGQLSAAAGVPIANAEDVLAALTRRAEFFAALGGRLSDHDFGRLPGVIGTVAQANAAFEKRMNGGMLTEEECDAFKGWLIVALSGVFCRLNWTMQLHISSMRNNSTRMFALTGKDSGYDVMSDFEVAQRLSRLLDAMDREGTMPRTVLYSLNPKDFYPMIALCGCFTQAGIRGKTQFGSAWWMVDHRDGMEQQLRTTASINLLSAFVGMLTDSRSFLSYPRHEYFRRILCNLIGGWVEAGEYPDDRELLEKIVKGVCYQNAEAYFAF